MCAEPPIIPVADGSASSEPRSQAPAPGQERAFQHRARPSGLPQEGPFLHRPLPSRFWGLRDPGFCPARGKTSTRREGRGHWVGLGCRECHAACSLIRMYDPRPPPALPTSAHSPGRCLNGADSPTTWLSDRAGGPAPKPPLPRRRRSTVSPTLVRAGPGHVWGARPPRRGAGEGLHPPLSRAAITDAAA